MNMPLLRLVRWHGQSSPFEQFPLHYKILTNSSLKHTSLISTQNIIWCVRSLWPKRRSYANKHVLTSLLLKPVAFEEIFHIISGEKRLNLLGIYTVVNNV